MPDRLDLARLTTPAPYIDASTADALAMALSHAHAYAQILQQHPAVDMLLRGKTPAEVDALAVSILVIQPAA